MFPYKNPTKCQYVLKVKMKRQKMRTTNIRKRSGSTRENPPPNHGLVTFGFGKRERCMEKSGFNGGVK